MGIIYYNAESYKEAILFLKKAIALSQHSPDLFRSGSDVFSAYNNVGLCYRKMNMYDSAIYFHKACIALSQNRNNSIWKAIAEGNIGIALIGKKQYDSAYLLIEKDLAASLKHKEWRSAAVDYSYLAEISDYRNEYRKAELLFDSANQLIRNNKLIILSYFNKMAMHYKMIGNYKAGYFCMERFHALRDSLQILQNSKALALINANNQFEKKLVELELMAKDNELKAQQLRLQKFVIVSILFITALSITLIIILYKRNVFRRKLNIQLERTVDKRTRKLIDINKQLDTFIYRSSHDMRRPLTTLLGLNYLGQKTVTDPNAREILRMVGETARNMDAMLQKLRTIHELNTRKLKLSSCYLQDVLSNEINKLENEFRQNDIEVTSTISYTHLVTTDSHLIGIIARNLLENAIHFRQPRNNNRVSLTVEGFANDYYFIEVEDRGIGIDKTIRESIFQPFFRGSDQSPGNGLGLFLVKKAVAKLKGTITIESEFGSGARFRVLLPLNKAIQKPDWVDYQF